MKPFALSLPSTIAGAAYAAFLLAATPARLHADDDKKDDKHKKEEHHDAHKKEDRKEEVHTRKDDVVKHVFDHPKVEEHHTKVEEEHHNKVVVDHHVDHVDHVVDHHDRVVGHTFQGHIVHTHPHYKLHYGNGWRGRGYYYGPPGVDYYNEGPDLAFYSSQDEAPPEYLTEGPEDSGPDGPAPAPVPTAVPNDSPAAAVQAALADKGYYSGAVDGNLGPMTSRAIARYQSDNGLRATGTINEALLHALKID